MATDPSNTGSSGPGFIGAMPPAPGTALSPTSPRQFDISSLPAAQQRAITVGRAFVRDLSDLDIQGVMFAVNEYLFAEKTAQVRALLAAALMTEGGHHKQWYLEKIAEVFVVDLAGLDYPKGIAP